MKKIVIEIKNNTLLFKYRTNKPVEPNLLNTNVICNNELVFSDEYLINNSKIVALFIADLVKEKNTTEVTISNNELAEIALDLFVNLTSISLLTLKEDVNLSFSLCEKIAKLNNIKKISCYSIPTFMLEMLDKKNIEVESRSEVLFTSNFMQENNLTSYSKMYYKNNVKITKQLTEEDIEDFKSFCQINKYLKTIHLENSSIDDIKKLCDILSTIRKKGTLIEIHDDINDIDIIEELRKLNKHYKQKYKIKLSLVYSKDYLEKNYLKQIIFTTLKICALIIFVIVGSIFGYIFYNNYQSEKKVDDIQSELKSVMENDTSLEEEIPTEDENIENEQITNIEEPSLLLQSYQKLLEINTDAVGWLTVKGTKIDYPVVQTTDNSYYLSRNFNREKDYNGWVFMDYRNNPENLNSNTIIYAHNRYYSGVMFGTLNNVTKKAWLDNPENYEITFNTMKEEMVWKVFSIYNIEVTSDYLYTNFNTKSDYQEFLNMISKRSKYKFDQTVTTDDKILTLSTCLDNNRRLVVHAVLVKNDTTTTDENTDNIESTETN